MEDDSVAYFAADTLEFVRLSRVADDQGCELDRTVSTAVLRT